MRRSSLHPVDGWETVTLTRRAQLRAGEWAGTMMSLQAAGVTEGWTLPDRGHPVAVGADAIAALQATPLHQGSITLWVEPRGPGRTARYVGAPMSLRLGDRVAGALRARALAEGLDASTLARSLIAAGLGVSDG